MITFLSHIHFQNTIAEYEIFKKGEKYRALLVMNEASVHLPLELSFWKENGQWRTNHMLTEHVLYQFGYTIDNQLLSHTIDELKRCAA